MNNQPDNNRLLFSLPGIGKVELIIMPFSIAILGEQNQLLTRVSGVCFPNSQGQWQYVHLAEVIHAAAATFQVRLSSFTSPEMVHLSIQLENNSILMKVRSDEGSSLEWMGLDLSARQDEHFLGLGERFDHLDQRGHKVNLFVENSMTGGAVYKPIPFYISTAGYGLQLLTDVFCSLHLAAEEKPAYVTIRNNSSSLDVRFIFGKDPKEILSRYTDYCGRLPLPPAWIFRPWKSRSWETDNSRSLLEDIKMEQEYNLPAAIKVIDAGWQPYYHSFTFDIQKFPNPAGLIEQVHQSGSRLVIWVSPWLSYLDPPSERYLECEQKGFFIKNSLGQTYVHRITNSPCMLGTCLDFTNPGAVAWWQDHLRNLLHMGVDGFKTDFGEQIPEDALFYNGLSGHEMHNIYPRLYNQVTYQVMNQEKEGILIARSAWHGSQAYSAVWAGDQTSDFSPATGLKSVVLAGQNAGLSGFPYWGSDIGGYFGSPTDEVFIRWSQFGAFSPIMKIHGLGIREPWLFSEKTLAVYRKFAHLHVDLFPYLYTYARMSSQTGIPIMRSLSLEFPEDKGVWGDLSQHEYCFGEQLLVAPVYYGFNCFRYVYLPAGTWRDFWTGKSFEGGQIHTMDADLDSLPVLARAGAIIPFLDPPCQGVIPAAGDASLQAAGNLRIHIYPGADNRFELYDGTSFTWQEENWTVIIENSPVQRQFSILLFTPELGTSGITNHQTSKPDSLNSSFSGESAYTNIWVSPGESFIISFNKSE